MRTKVSGALGKQRTRLKRYFGKKIRILPTSTVGQMIYVNRPPLNILPVDRRTFTKYSKLMPRTTGPFKLLDVQDHVMLIDKNSIAKSVSIDRATPVGFQHFQKLLNNEQYRHPNTNLHKERRVEFVIYKV